MVRYADSAEGDLQRELARADDNGMTQARGAVGATGALPGWSGPLPDGPQPGLKQSLLDGMTSAQRKEYPITTGCLDYFRDALLLVSHVSYKGNQKHNKGEPLHWARSKSADEEDAIGRHLVNRYEMDPEIDLEEAAQLAWRALAFLQKLAEKKHNIKPPVGCK
jgi:hypothetical protein